MLALKEIRSYKLHLVKKVNFLRKEVKKRLKPVLTKTDML